MIFDNGKAVDVSEPTRIFEKTNQTKCIWIRNLGPGDVSVGGEGVQMDNGVWLPPNGQLHLDELPNDLWAVGNASVVVVRLTDY